MKLEYFYRDWVGQNIATAYHTMPTYTVINLIHVSKPHHIDTFSIFQSTVISWWKIYSLFVLSTRKLSGTTRGGNSIENANPAIMKFIHKYSIDASHSRLTLARAGPKTEGNEDCMESNWILFDRRLEWESHERKTRATPKGKRPKNASCTWFKSWKFTNVFPPKI